MKHFFLSAFHFILSRKPYLVFSDWVSILRVFTNLIKKFPFLNFEEPSLYLTISYLLSFPSLFPFYCQFPVVPSTSDKYANNTKFLLFVYTNINRRTKADIDGSQDTRQTDDHHRSSWSWITSTLCVPLRAEGLKDHKCRLSVTESQLHCCCETIWYYLEMWASFRTWSAGAKSWSADCLHLYYGCHWMHKNLSQWRNSHKVDPWMITCPLLDVTTNYTLFTVMPPGKAFLLTQNG